MRYMKISPLFRWMVRSWSLELPIKKMEWGAKELAPLKLAGALNIVLL